MFTETDALHGWLVYGAAAFIGLICWWFLLKVLPLKPLRPVLMTAMAALLLTPWSVADGNPFLAPAWLIAGSEGLFDGMEFFWRAGKPLLMIIAAAAAVALVAQIAWTMFGPEPKTSDAPKEAGPTH